MKVTKIALELQDISQPCPDIGSEAKGTFHIDCGVQHIQLCSALTAPGAFECHVVPGNGGPCPQGEMVVGFWGEPLSLVAHILCYWWFALQDLLCFLARVCGCTAVENQQLGISSCF